MESAQNRTVTFPGVPWSSRIAFVIFLTVAIAAMVVTMRLDVPGAVWGLRIVITLGAAGFAIYLARRDLGGQATDLDRTAVDRWTIVHSSAGVVFGLFGIPFLLVALLTVAWEVFEILAPGFGETEVIQNRAMDVLVAWAGWLVVAGLIALLTQTELPFLLPAADSLLRR